MTSRLGEKNKDNSQKTTEEQITPEKTQQEEAEPKEEKTEADEENK